MITLRRLSCLQPLVSAGLGLCGLLWWEISVRASEWSELVLPAPSRIAQVFWQGLVSGYWWPHIGQSLLTLLLGWLLGASAGFGMGVLLSQARLLRRWLTPYIVISQVTPKVALAPLFMLWFGFGTLPGVIMTALICFFPLLENTLTALEQTDRHQMALFRSLRAGTWSTLWRLQIPAGRHTLSTGLRIALVLAWVGTVVSEFMSASHGLGAVIIAAQGSMDTPLLFASLLWIALLGVLSLNLISRVLPRPPSS